MSVRTIVVAAVVSVLQAAAAGPAIAQTPVSLTLEEAIRRAIDAAPRLAEAEAREAAAAAVLAGRRAERLPTLTASGSVVRTNHIDEFAVVQPSGDRRVIFPDIPSTYHLRSELQVPLYTGGRIGAMVSAAAAEARAERAERRVTEQDVRLDAARAYWHLATAREAVSVLERSAARMDAWVADVRSRVEAGVLPPNDVLSAEAEQARQTVRVLRAREQAAVAEDTLAVLVGLSLDQAIAPVTAPTEPLPSAVAAADDRVEALVRRALAARDERAALEARVEAANAARDAAAAGRRPHVAAVAAVEPARPNNRFVPRVDEWNTSWDVGVHVAWPLWDGGRSRAEGAAAAARADAVTHRLRDFDNGVSAAVRARVLAIETGRAASAAADRAVVAAAEARRVVAERFAAGVATSTDVLDAELALLEAELERMELAAAERVREAELLRTIGEGG
jgi:outer membrane protein